ncbi:MAG: peptide deformylase [Erysipelotrichaceae bacterium]|nr:peptide deformylase [Erysipelotrichaceae bacterium]
MVKEIVRDVFFLRQKAIKATKDDLYIGQDLRDTLKANREACVGMAANMIGYNKAIIIVNMGLVDVVMYNPKITSQKNPYKAVEGCLSLMGQRETTRYKDITVEYFDESFVKHKNNYSGYIAQIIQHECNHLDGIII